MKWGAIKSEIFFGKVNVNENQQLNRNKIILCGRDDKKKKHENKQKIKSKKHGVFIIHLFTVRRDGRRFVVRVKNPFPRGLRGKGSFQFREQLILYYEALLREHIQPSL